MAAENGLGWSLSKPPSQPFLPPPAPSNASAQFNSSQSLKQLRGVYFAGLGRAKASPAAFLQCCLPGPSPRRHFPLQGWGWEAALPVNIPRKLLFLPIPNEFWHKTIKKQKNPRVGLIISGSWAGSLTLRPLLPQSSVQIFETLISWNKRSSSHHKLWGESVNPAILLCWPLDHHLSFGSLVYMWGNTARGWSIHPTLRPQTLHHRAGSYIFIEWLLEEMDKKWKKKNQPCSFITAFS